jgi:hypothetical protein
MRYQDLKLSVRGAQDHHPPDVKRYILQTPSTFIPSVDSICDDNTRSNGDITLETFKFIQVDHDLGEIRRNSSGVIDGYYNIYQHRQDIKTRQCHTDVTARECDTGTTTWTAREAACTGTTNSTIGRGRLHDWAVIRKDTVK